MSYVVGQIIENEDYNAFLDRVKEVYCDNHSRETVESLANYGYGQQSELTTKKDGDLVTAADWDNLVALVKDIALYQGTTIPSLPISINVGDIIAVMANMDNAITAITTNRFNAMSSKLKIDNVISDVRKGAFSGTVAHEFVASFNSYDEMRYFFNANGKIIINPKLDASTTHPLKPLFNNILKIEFKHTTTDKFGGTPQNNSTGFYNLTDTYQIVYSETINSVTAKISCKLDGIAGTATSMRVKVEYISVNSVPNCRLNNVIDVQYANSTEVTVTPPMFTNVVTMNGSNPPSAYAPTIDIISDLNTSDERIRHYDRVESDVQYDVVMNNAVYMDFYDTNAYDPEYAMVGDVVFKYAYDQVTNKEKMVVKTDSGVVTFFRGTTQAEKESGVNRTCVIDILDVQNGTSPLVFNYVMEYTDQKSIKTFKYFINDTMFAWDEPLIVDDVAGSVNTISGYRSTQKHYGVHSVSLFDSPDTLHYMVGGAGADGFYVARHNVYGTQGALDPSFGNNGYKVLSVGQYGGGVVTKIINATNTVSASYAVIGYCIVNGNTSGFIALLNNVGQYITNFNGTGLYIEQSLDSTVYHDIEVDSGGKFVVLYSYKDRPESLYRKTFNEFGLVENEITVYDENKYGAIKNAKLIKQPTSATGYTFGACFNVFDNVVDIDGRRFQSVIIGDVYGEKTITENKTNFKLGLLNTSAEDAAIIYSPYSMHTDFYDGLFDDCAVVYTYANGNVLVAQPCIIGNETQPSYGISVQRLIGINSGFEIDDTFAVSYNSNNTWLSHINPAATSLPPTSQERYVPRQIFTDANDDIYITGSYVISSTNNSFEQKIRMFIMKLDKYGNSMPTIVFDEGKHGSHNVTNSVLHTYEENGFTKTAIVNVGCFKHLDGEDQVVEFGTEEEVPVNVNVGYFVNRTEVTSNIDIQSNSYGNDGYVYLDTSTKFDGEEGTSALSSYDGSKFGNSVSISADGKIAVVGAKDEYDEKGAVKIYKQTDSGTFALFKVLTPPSNIVAGAHFGHSVSITDDGKIILVTAPNAKYSLNNFNINNTGMAIVYQYDGVDYDTDPQSNTWVQTSEIYSNNPVTAMEFGGSGSISADGAWIAIGSPADLSNKGAAYLYKYNVNTQSIDVNFQRIDGAVTSGRFGDSVKLSSKNYQFTTADVGYVALISSPNITISGKVNVGCARLYSNCFGGNFTLQAEFFPSVIENNTYYAKSIELSNYGTTAFCSAGELTGLTNKVIVNDLYFTKKVLNNVTTDVLSVEKVHTIALDDDLDEVYSLSCGHDGRTIAIGVSGVFQNHVDIYHRTSKAFEAEVYVQQCTITTPSMYSMSDSGGGYGVVCLASLNNNLIVGAPFNNYHGFLEGNSNIGKVYFYVPQNKNVDFVISGEDTVVENNIYQYINKASGTITITKNKNELVYEELRIDDEVIRINRTDLNSVKEFSKGYIVVSKQSDSLRNWKFYPKWDVYNLDNNVDSGVPVVLSYSTYSKTNKRVTKSFTITVIDGEPQVNSVYLPTMIYSSSDVVKVYQDVYGGKNETTENRITDNKTSGYLFYDQKSDRFSNNVLTINTTDSLNALIDVSDIQVLNSTHPQQVVLADKTISIHESTNDDALVYTFSTTAVSPSNSSSDVYIPLNRDGKTFVSSYFVPNGEINYISSGAGYFDQNNNLVRDDSFTYYRFVVHGVHNRDIVDKVVIVGPFGDISSDSSGVYTNNELTLKLDDYVGYRLENINDSGYKLYDDPSYYINRNYVSSRAYLPNNVSTKFNGDFGNSTIYTFYVKNNTDRMVVGKEYTFKVHLNRHIGHVYAGTYSLNVAPAGVNYTDRNLITGSLSATKKIDQTKILMEYCSGDNYPTINSLPYDFYISTNSNVITQKPKIVFRLMGKHNRDYISQVNVFGVFGDGSDIDDGFRMSDIKSKVSTFNHAKTYLQLFTDGNSISKASCPVEYESNECIALSPSLIQPTVNYVQKPAVATLYPKCTNYSIAQVKQSNNQMPSDDHFVTTWEWECINNSNYGPFVMGNKYDVTVKHNSGTSIISNSMAYHYLSGVTGYIAYYNEHEVFKIEGQKTSSLSNDSYDGVTIEACYTTAGTANRNPKITLEMRGALPITFINKVLLIGEFNEDYSGNNGMLNSYNLQMNTTLNAENATIDELIAEYGVYAPFFSNFYTKKVRDSINGREMDEYVSVWEWEYLLPTSSTTNQLVRLKSGTMKEGKQYQLTINDGKQHTFKIMSTDPVPQSTGLGSVEFTITSTNIDSSNKDYVYRGYSSSPNRPNVGSILGTPSLGGFKIRSLLSVPTKQYYFDTMYGTTLYELQIEGEHPVDLFKTLTINGNFVPGQNRLFGSKYGKPSSTTLTLQTNRLVNKYTGGKYYGSALPVQFNRRSKDDTINNIDAPQNKTIMDVSVNNKYGWDKSVNVKLLATYAEGVACFLYESNGPYLHDHYSYPIIENGAQKTITVWQWMAGYPVYSNVYNTDYSTMEVPLCMSKNSVKYTVKIDSPDVVSAAPTLVPSYIEMDQSIDMMNYGDREIYKPFTISTNATAHIPNIKSLQTTTIKNIDTDVQGDVKKWDLNTGYIAEGNVLHNITTNTGTTQLYINSFVVKNGVAEILVSTNNNVINLNSYIDRIVISNVGAQLYNGRTPTMTIDSIMRYTGLTEAQVTDDYYETYVQSSIRFIKYKINLNEWVQIKDKTFKVTFIMNTSGNVDVKNKYTPLRNSSQLLVHGGSINLAIKTTQLDGDIATANDETTIINKHYSYDTIDNEYAYYSLDADTKELYKSAAYYGIGPESNVTSTPPMTGTNPNRPSGWYRRTLMNKHVPCTNIVDGKNIVKVDINFNELITKKIQTVNTTVRTPRETLVGASCQVNNGCIISYDGKLSVTETNNKEDVTNDFRFKKGGGGDATDANYYNINVNKGLKRVLRMMFYWVKKWS